MKVPHNPKLKIVLAGSFLDGPRYEVLVTEDGWFPVCGEVKHMPNTFRKLGALTVDNVYHEVWVLEATSKNASAIMQRNLMLSGHPTKAIARHMLAPKARGVMSVVEQMLSLESATSPQVTSREKYVVLRRDNAVWVGENPDRSLVPLSYTDTELAQFGHVVDKSGIAIVTAQTGAEEHFVLDRRLKNTRVTRVIPTQMRDALLKGRLVVGDELKYTLLRLGETAR